MAETGASAGTGYWIVNEDGCLPVIDNIESVIYHPSLNVVLVTSKTGVVQVVDVTSGAIFHSSDLSADAVEGVRCNYLPSQDRVVFISDKAVGARRDLNGVLLLDSALQTTVSKPDGVVCVELTLPDAVHLCRYIKAADLPGVDYVTDVLKELDRQIEVMQRSNKRSHKSTKVDELVYLTDNSFTTAELLTMERNVLKVLRFDISLTTSVMFVARSLQVCNQEGCDKISLLTEMLSFYLLDLSLVDASFSSMRSSLKCAAAVSLSLHVIGRLSVQRCWFLGLKLIGLTDLKPAELEMCMCRMSRMLLRATEARNSQIQGAFKKYSQSKYLEVSKHPGLAEKVAYALTRIPYAVVVPTG